MSPTAPTHAPVRTPIAGVTGYEYGNTRLRARRSELLADAEYHELFLAGTTERMLGVLRTTAYGPDVERALVQHDALRRLDGAVRGHLVRSLGDMRRFYSGRAAEGVELLVGRWDLRNLLAVVRSKARPAARAELDSMLVPAGSLDATALAELAAQPSLRSAIELMVAWDLPSRPTARRLLREWPRYEATGDPSVFEDALTSAWFESVDHSLAAWSDTPLDSVVRAEVDQTNLLASLRRRDGSPAGSPDGDGVHLAGGTFNPRVLSRVEHAPTAADAFGVLAEQRLPHEWTAALRDWNEDHDLSALGGRIEREIARTAIGLFAHGDPLSIAIPVAFVWAKECEARNIRLLGRAVVHQLDWSDVEPELFPMVKQPTARLTVIVPPELASGFTIAGAEVEDPTDATAAGVVLDTLLRDAEPGIIGVYAPFYAALPAAMLERCERASQPVVIPLPAGKGEGGAAGHRARIAALLERAVGYHITFADEAR